MPATRTRGSCRVVAGHEALSVSLPLLFPSSQSIFVADNSRLSLLSVITRGLGRKEGGGGRGGGEGGGGKEGGEGEEGEGGRGRGGRGEGKGERGRRERGKEGGGGIGSRASGLFSYFHNENKISSYISLFP